MSGPETATVDRHDDEDDLTPEHQRWLCQLRWVQQMRGYRLAWISYTFQEGSGGGWTLLSPTTISASRLITTWRCSWWRRSSASGRSVPQRCRCCRCTSRLLRRRGGSTSGALGGSACGHLREWHLKNAPHRFSEDLSEVTCGHCRNGQGSDRSVAGRSACASLERAPAPRVVPVCHMLEGSWHPALIDEEDQGRSPTPVHQRRVRRDRRAITRSLAGPSKIVRVGRGYCSAMSTSLAATPKSPPARQLPYETMKAIAGLLVAARQAESRRASKRRSGCVRRLACSCSPLNPLAFTL